jgi:hypothetical protein
MKSKNIKEFKALILRYENVTIEEIQESNCDPKTLTGFGSHRNCTLCKAIGVDKQFPRDIDCQECVWSRVSDCPAGLPCLEEPDAYDTYDAINDAKLATELKHAFTERAKLMRTILTKLRIKQP